MIETNTDFVTNTINIDKTRVEINATRRDGLRVNVKLIDSGMSGVRIDVGAAANLNVEQVVFIKGQGSGNVMAARNIFDNNFKRT